MNELAEGETLELAAIRSGMGETTARRYRNGAPVKGRRPVRTYRTRRDPFEAVWGEIETMLELAPGLEAKTIFEQLQERPGAGYTEGQTDARSETLRNLARRLIMKIMALKQRTTPLIEKPENARHRILTN